jgi:thiosulfate/3-mercaptopyruvate sulfurtransferase
VHLPNGGTHAGLGVANMEQDSFKRPELLADPDWVASATGDPGVCIVDCAAARGTHWGFIPGAVPLPLHFSLKDPDDPLHVTSREHFAEAMSRLGIGEETVVVAYDRLAGMAAARLWWVLSYYGHSAVKILDGGWQRWRAEGRPAALRPGQREPARFVAQPDRSKLATRDYVRKHLDDPDTCILDVRNRAEFSGHNPWGNRRAGHIPGSLHWEWVQNLDGQEPHGLRPASELRAELTRLGLSPDKEVITHCQAGIRASHAAFVLTLLGYPRVRNYEASMKEWANADDTPMQEGEPEGNGASH